MYSIRTYKRAAAIDLGKKRSATLARRGVCVVGGGGRNSAAFWEISIEGMAPPSHPRLFLFHVHKYVAITRIARTILALVLKQFYLQELDWHFRGGGGTFAAFII